MYLLAAAWFLATTTSEAKRFAGLSIAFCHLQPDGQVFCAGDNYYGQLGVGSTRNTFATPVQILGVTEASDVSMAETHTCIVDQGGRARCVGYDFSSRYILGDGTSTSSSVLVNVLGLQSGVAQVFSAVASNCALMATGAAWCWGENLFGGLGSGSSSIPAQPVQVFGFETGGAIFIAMGDYHTCVLSTLGKLLCTGWNANGQLGTGSTSNSNKPTPVLGLGTSTEFVSVSCGRAHTCAVSTAGAVLCWGENRGGQLGLGSTTTYFTSPQQVTALAGASSVWASEDNTFVTMSDGTARAFGKSTFGELGGGIFDPVLSPMTFASGVSNIYEVRGGRRTTCLLFLDDTIQCLGENTKGQFGSGSTTPSSSRVLVSRLTAPATSSKAPTLAPTTNSPTTKAPSLAPTVAPSNLPTTTPTHSPIGAPTSVAPTRLPSRSPTNTPTNPTPQPTRRPTVENQFGGAASLSASFSVLMAVVAVQA